MHEPRAALDGGADGLDIVRLVGGHAAKPWLAENGHLLVETSERQAAGGSGRYSRAMAYSPGWSARPRWNATVGSSDDGVRPHRLRRRNQVNAGEMTDLVRPVLALDRAHRAT